MCNYLTSCNGLRAIVFSIVAVLLFTAMACEGVKKEWVEVLNPPDPQIIGQQGEEAMSGFDYRFDVFCTIRNDGGTGNITVKAKLQKGGSWEKREVIHLSENASHNLTFKFTEPSLRSGGLGSGKYWCEAVPGGTLDQNSSPAAAPQSTTTASPEVRQSQATRKPTPTALPRQGNPVARPTSTSSERSASRPSPTNEPGKVSPGQVAGEFVSVSNPVFPRSGSEELVVVTFRNTSNVSTHYTITASYSGTAYDNGWRIISYNGVRCSYNSEKKLRAGLGSCQEQDVDPGDKIEVHYTLRSSDAGSASITWILTASHTCGGFGCREIQVDEITESFSVSTR